MIEVRDESHYTEGKKERDGERSLSFFWNDRVIRHYLLYRCNFWSISNFPVICSCSRKINRKSVSHSISRSTKYEIKTHVRLSYRQKELMVNSF